MMSNRIVLFNVIYYAVTITLIKLGWDDPSSSLGYGYFMVVFWVISAAVLFFLLVKRIIRPQSLLDKLGTFTATPVLSIVAVSVLLAHKETVNSEWQFNRNNYRYLERKVANDNATGGERIEHYKSANPIDSEHALVNNEWVKDSTWIYISKTGDTIKKITYKNGILVSKE